MKIPAHQLTPQPGLASGGGVCREPVSVVIGACWMCFDEMTHFLAKHVERWEELQESWKRLYGKIRGRSLRCFCQGSKYTMTTVIYIKSCVIFPSGQIVGNQSHLWSVPVQRALIRWFISPPKRVHMKPLYQLCLKCPEGKWMEWFTRNWNIWYACSATSPQGLHEFEEMEAPYVQSDIEIHKKL